MIQEYLILEVDQSLMLNNLQNDHAGMHHPVNFEGNILSG